MIAVRIVFGGSHLILPFAFSQTRHQQLPTALDFYERTLAQKGR